jgi:hypothetical protein
MENSKVILPRDVAEAIEKLRSYGFSNWVVMDKAQGAICSDPDLTLHKWAFDEEGEGTPDLLMSALVNGYLTDKTPEEKVREYFDSLSPKGRDETDYEHGATDAILEVLDMLGIEIAGINA